MGQSWAPSGIWCGRSFVEGGKTKDEGVQEERQHDQVAKNPASTAVFLFLPQLSASAIPN